jgi:hypothetical protein
MTLSIAIAWISPEFGRLRPGTGGIDVGPLVETGAVAFKLSQFGTEPRRFPRIPDDQFLEVLAAIREHASVACVHAEKEKIHAIGVRRHLATTLSWISRERPVTVTGWVADAITQAARS